jgi:hypothetical protein
MSQTTDSPSYYKRKGQMVGFLSHCNPEHSKFHFIISSYWTTLTFGIYTPIYEAKKYQNIQDQSIISKN